MFANPNDFSFRSDCTFHIMLKLKDGETDSFYYGHTFLECLEVVYSSIHPLAEAFILPDV